MVSTSALRKRLFLLTLLTLIGLRSTQAGVDVLLEPNTVPLNESFQITFEIDSSTQTSPDFSPLQEDFDILARSQSTNITMINGQYRAVTRWTLEVMAKRPGTLNIPPIHFGSEQSPAKTITVTQAQESTGHSSTEEIFFEVEAQPKNPYVQAQVIYTVRLFRAVNTHSSSLSEPQVKGGKVLIQKLGDDTSFEARRDGRRYLVVERKYAIFSQSSGRLVIEPLVFTGRVGGGQRLLSDPFGANQRVTRARSEPITLEVRPIPEAFTGSNWLPANQLFLRDTWTNDPPVFKVGEPATRTLALIAGGLTSAQLPELRPDIPEVFKQYPDQPSLNDKPDADGVVGVRQEKTALIPSQAGTFLLPEITVPWWNTAQERMEYAHLPELEVTVAPTAAPQPAPSTAAKNFPQEAKSDTPVVAPAAKSEPPPAVPLTWIILSGTLALGWGLTGLSWWLSRRSGKQQASSSTLPKQAVRQALKDIKRACEQNDPSAAKNALLRWSEIQWPQTPPGSLGVTAERCELELKGEIDRLNQMLYGQEPATWQGAGLWRAIQRHSPVPTTPDSDPEASKLEPLYRI